MRVDDFVSLGLHRHEHHVTVTHTALGDNVVSKRLDLGTAPLQHGHFETAIVADMHVQRGLRKMMMVMEFLCQALRNSRAA